MKMSHNNGMESRVGLSVGISIFPLHATTMDGLLSASDQAMYMSNKLARTPTASSTVVAYAMRH